MTTCNKCGQPVCEECGGHIGSVGARPVKTLLQEKYQKGSFAELPGWDTKYPNTDKTYMQVLLSRYSQALGYVFATPAAYKSMQEKVKAVFPTPSIMVKAWKSIGDVPFYTSDNFPTTNFSMEGLPPAKLTDFYTWVWESVRWPWVSQIGPSPSDPYVDRAGPYVDRILELNTPTYAASESLLVSLRTSLKKRWASPSTMLRAWNKTEREAPVSTAPPADGNSLSDAAIRWIAKTLSDGSQKSFKTSNNMSPSSFGF